MARFRPSSRIAGAAPLALLAGALLAPGACAVAAVGDENKCTEDIVVNADSFDADYKSNTTELRNVVISQCDIRVEARRASTTGLNFDDTRWTFEGNVRIDVEKRGSLRSNQAVVDFRNNQISRATITGTPAEFEQRRGESDMMARGHAGEIVYEVGAGTVRLANDAWLKYGTTEMKGASLVYNIRQENVQGGAQPGDSERVHIRISPKSKSGTQPPRNDGRAKAAAPANAPRAP